MSNHGQQTAHLSIHLLERALQALQAGSVAQERAQELARVAAALESLDRGGLGAEPARVRRHRAPA